MAGNSFGQIFKLTTFGESHGPAIGGVIDGCPAGLTVHMDFIRNEMLRRKPSQSSISSSRNENDAVEFLSGVFEGKTTGTPIGFIIRNTDQKSSDYKHIKNSYRPSHADFTYEIKYGFRDYRGGGRSSARETAARVVGGAIAKLFLQQFNIKITAYVSSIGEITLDKEYNFLNLNTIESSPVRCPDEAASNKMINYLDGVKKEKDSAGGIITCITTGLPPGLGEPVFDKAESELAKAIMSINAVKGFDIGSGFKSAKLKGSENNDIFVSEGGNITTATNNSGGVQGGLSNGQDIWFRAAFKPVATIMQDQKSVDNKGKEIIIEGKGRHDVCVVPRAVPIVEAMAALTFADLYLRNRNSKLQSF